MEDIANGVTNGIFENPTHEEMSGVEVKVDTGDVDENGDIVYADAEGHRDDESGYPNPDPFENTPGPTLMTKKRMDTLVSSRDGVAPRRARCT